MRFRSTLVLLIIAGVLGIAILILHYTIPPTKEWDKLKKQLVPVEADDIVKVQIDKAERSGVPTNVGSGEQIICERAKDKDWQITAPIKTRANQLEMDSITFEIERLSKEKAVTSPANLSEYGLDKPRASVVITDKKNQSYHFKIGNDAPMEQGVYLQLVVSPSSLRINEANLKEETNEIYLVDSSFWKAIDKTLFDLRDKKVTTIDPALIEQIKLIRPGEAIEFIRKEVDEWMISKPVSEKASTDKMRFFLSEIDGLQAESFVAEYDINLSKYGLDKPVLEITLSGANQTETILWGSSPVTDTDKIYITKKGDNPIIILESSTLANLNLPLNDFRDRKLFNLSFDKVKQIETRKLGKVLMQLEKIENKWELLQPKDVPLEWNGAGEFIRHINQTRIEDFVADNVIDLSPYGLISPTLEVTIGFTDEQPDLKIALAPTTDTTHIYLKKSNENRVVMVENELFDIVNKGVLFVRKKGLLSIQRYKIIRCTIEKEGTKTICEQEKPGVWNIVAPEKQKIEDTTQLVNILNKITYLTVKEFVAQNPTDLASYGLDKPIYRVEIEYILKVTTASREGTDVGADKTEKKVILVGKKTEQGNYYGMIEGEALVFILSSDIVTPLEKDINAKE